MPQPAGTGDEVIHLHMPVRTPALHRIHLRVPTLASPGASLDAIGAERATTAQTASEAGRQTGRSTRTAHALSLRPAIPLNFGDETAPATDQTQSAALARGTETASIAPRATLPHASSTLASTPDDRAGLSKHGAVLFDKGVSDPSPAQFKGVKLLAGDLATALEAGASRVQLEAYGGTPGDKSSDARRLSLKRALAVRQLLIDDGVPSTRIDVRAMGGVNDKGPTDRVDVFVRTG